MTRTGGVPRSLLSIVLALTLLGVAIACWLPGLGGPYHFDDCVTPLSDPASQSLAAWWRHAAHTLRPLTKLSYALEGDLGLASGPAPRRLTSLVLHGIAAALLWLLVMRLQPELTWRGAAFVALVWVSHPVHADGVLMLSGRSAVLAGGLVIATLLALERSRPLAAGVLFVLACLARETAIAALLPAAVLVAGRPGATTRGVLRELLPLFGGFVVILCWLSATPRYVALAEFSFLGRPWWTSVVAQVGAVPRGLELLLDPRRLAIDYGLPLPATGRDPMFLAGSLLFAAAAVGSVHWARSRRARAAAVGSALWLAAVLPTQSVVPKLDALSNRPLGLALAGLLLTAAPVLAALAQPRASRRQAGKPRSVAFVPGIAGLIVLALLASATVRRSALFDSEILLWRDAAVKSRTNARPHLQYALLLTGAGRAGEARQALSRARAIDPFSARIEDLWRAGRPREHPP